MGVVWMPSTMVMMVPVHCGHRICRQPSDAYLLHLLRQQQEMERYIRRERYMMMRFTWRFPGCDSILKINTDGSSKGNPGASSFEGLIRDNKGRWLCGYMGKMKGRDYTSLEAEAWSVYRGLCLIKEKKLSCLLIETDYQPILMHGVRKVNERKEEDDWLESVFGAMENMMMELRCTLVHTRRDGNHCTDKLANLGGMQTEEYIKLEEPPTVLIPYLLRDIESALEFKRINERLI